MPALTPACPCLLLPLTRHHGARQRLASLCAFSFAGVFVQSPSCSFIVCGRRQQRPTAQKAEVERSGARRRAQRWRRRGASLSPSSDCCLLSLGSRPVPRASQSFAGLPQPPRALSTAAQSAQSSGSLSTPQRACPRGSLHSHAVKNDATPTLSSTGGRTQRAAPQALGCGCVTTAAA